MFEFFKKLVISRHRTKIDTSEQPEGSKGYIVKTKDGHILTCASQRLVAEALTQAYGIPVTRDHVHRALSRYKGRLAYQGNYVATIKYRKETENEPLS